MNIKLILIININSSRRDFTKKVLPIHRKEQLFIYLFFRCEFDTTGGKPFFLFSYFFFYLIVIKIYIIKKFIYIYNRIIELKYKKSSTTYSDIYI